MAMNDILYNGQGTSAPAASFQSTSTLAKSGSAYASQPMLNSDGTAAYYSSAETTYTSSVPGGGPRRIGPVTPEGDPTPIGDVLLPLMMMAAVYGLWRGIRWHKAK